jgi:glutamate-ammonia-ligase adenylyltransferase
MEKTRADVVDMRRLMLKELPPTSLWDIKRARGGLVEIEFIAQYLQLVSAPENPAVLDTNTAGALDRLAAAGCLDKQVATELHDATALYHCLTQVLRLCVDGPYDPVKVPEGLNRLVANAAATPDLAQAEALLAETQARIARRFENIIGPVT